MELNLLNQEEIATLRNLLSNATNIVICAHKSPDGDATGSSLAWMHWNEDCVVLQSLLDLVGLIPL